MAPSLITVATVALACVGSVSAKRFNLMEERFGQNQVAQNNYQYSFPYGTGISSSPYSVPTTWTYTLPGTGYTQPTSSHSTTWTYTAPTSKPASSKPVTTQKMTTSTVYTTKVHTVTSCHSTVTDCPAGPRTITETIPLYTTICPVTETEHEHKTKHPATSTQQTQQMVTSTVYTTRVHTVTTCDATVTDCPAGPRTITDTIPLYTTICPLTETGNGSGPTTWATETATSTAVVTVTPGATVTTSCDESSATSVVVPPMSSVVVPPMSSMVVPPMSSMVPPMSSAECPGCPMSTAECSGPGCPISTVAPSSTMAVPPMSTMATVPMSNGTATGVSPPIQTSNSGTKTGISMVAALGAAALMLL